MSDGGYVEVRYKGPETLRKNEVFIIEHDSSKKIFIWVGSEAPVRMKFISSQIASQIRMTMGLTFKITTIEEGLETRDFMEITGLQPAETSPQEEISTSVQTGATDITEEPSAQLVRQTPVSAPVRSTATKPTPVRSTVKLNKPKSTGSGLLGQLEDEASKLEEKIPVQKKVPQVTSTSTVTTEKSPVESVVSDEQVQIISDFVQKTIETSSVNLDNFHETAIEEKDTVSKKQARRIIDNRTVNPGKRVILNRIYVSYNGNNIGDKALEFYSAMKNDEHEDCSYRAPICKVFLHKHQTGGYLLHIPIPEGASLYYSCPGGIFFSLMFAEI
jgi:hypothetical protein